MLNLNAESMKNTEEWKKAGIELPKFDREKIKANTKENPEWVHFGSGNIFRGFPAALQQKLLDEGKAQTGIIAVETFDFEIIDKIYAPYDNLSLLVIMKADGSLEKRVIGSIVEGLVASESRAQDWARLHDVFTKPSLKMASFTITEKGYSLKNMAGEFFPVVVSDMQEGPAHPKHVMSIVASLAYTRYKNGKLPITFASMDNCSHNGSKIHEAVETIVKKWVESGLVESDFLAYINDESKVTFPWSMIDKITPRPADEVKEALKKIGFENTEIVITDKHTYTAPFVNAEGAQYLVVEDKFPNGRPPLELAGVLFTDRETVDKVEKMKVCTCLNPLHTALAVYGCVLGYELLSAEMKNSSLKKLVEKIGYEEGLPVVVNPGIIDPKSFIKEVLEERIPNPYMPDSPQRIATDTSQKVGIRFGETIKGYVQRADLDPSSLKYIPLAIAGWCRYLLGIDDNGEEFQISSDPMLETLKGYIANIKFGDVNSVGDSLKPILSNESLFGINLYNVGLGEKVEGYFKEMITGKGAVQATLDKYLA